MSDPTFASPLTAELILENLKDYAIFTANPQGLITSWNPGVQRVLGYEQEEFLGLPIADVFTPEDREAGVVEAELGVAASEGRSEDERWHCRKDGSRIWVHGIMAGLLDEAGNLCGYAKIMRDYTDRRHSEESRRKSEARYRLLLETIEDYAIVVLDLQGQIVSWNPGVADVFGYGDEEFVGQPSSILYPPEEHGASAPLRERERAMHSGRVAEERWLLHKDGRKVWVSSVTSVLRDEAGEVQGFVKIIRNETARKRAEEKRERLLEELKALNESLEGQIEERTLALRSSEERFSTAVGASPVPTLILRRSDGLILEVNESFLAMVARVRDEVVGQSVRDMELFGAVEAGSEIPGDLSRLEKLRPTEISVRTKSGELCYALITGKSIEFQKAPCLLATLIDITERMRTEEELRHAINGVMRESDWFAKEVMERLAQKGSVRADRAAVAGLTRRERQVLGLMATGRTNEGIGKDLGIARQTVDNYVSRIYGKIGVRTRTQAVVWARERGIVGMEQLPVG